MVLDTSLLNTQQYNLRIEGRVDPSMESSSAHPYPTPQCSSYWKGSLLVALHYGRQIYLLYFVREDEFFKIFYRKNESAMFIVLWRWYV